MSRTTELLNGTRKTTFSLKDLRKEANYLKREIRKDCRGKDIEILRDFLLEITSTGEVCVTVVFAEVYADGTLGASNERSTVI